MARHLFSRGIGRFVPAGFDLAAYAGAERMGAADWLANLWPRFYEFGPFDRSSELPFHVSARPVFGLRNTPIEEYSPMTAREPKTFYRGRGFELATPSVVGEFSGAALFMVADDAIEKDRTARETLKQGDPATPPSEQPPREMRRAAVAATIENELNEFGASLLLVDLHAPDDLILASVKALLPKLRARRRTPKRLKRFTAADFDRWATARVLAYADLMQWNRAEGQAPTDLEAAQILFPEDPNPERIRKTTRPLAVSLLSIRTVSALKAQVRAEPQPSGARAGKGPSADDPDSNRNFRPL